MSGTPPPFSTIAKLAHESGEAWSSYEKTVITTQNAESILVNALNAETDSDRLLNPDCSLVLCGSLARYEMVSGSDCDWTLLVDGVVSNQHAKIARVIQRTIEKTSSAGNGLRSPGTSGTFGNMCFSHDLVHRIGGGADSNENLTRRILMLLESRPISLSAADSSRDVWNAVVNSILERYFEEEAHFSPSGQRKVPRFLLNDLTRYWRTICVDYAAKYLEQDGRKWAMRNAKLRFSRKLLFAAGMAFCFACQLKPPASRKPAMESLFPGWEAADEDASAPFIAFAAAFARTSPLEFLAAFLDAFVSDECKRSAVSRKIFGAYNEWLTLLDDYDVRMTLDKLRHSDAASDPTFQKVQDIGSEFASGLKLLFFNRDNDPEDEIANLSLEYVAF